MPGDDRAIDFLPAATRDPDRVALTDGERVWSYGALATSADRVARDVLALGPAGVGRREVVATLLPPSPEAVVVAHAALRAGALLAPLNPKLTPSEISEALDALRPVRVIAAPATVDLARSAQASSDARLDVAVATVDRLEPPGTSKAREGASAGAATVPPDREVAVLWTSGTSGRPRGVVLRASALRHSAEASRTRLGLDADDRWYASLSPAHVGGLALVTRAGLLGSALVAGGGFDVGALNDAIDGGHVTHASVVPTMLARLLDARGTRPPPDGFGFLLVGGAHCPPELVERAARARLPVALTYGMTEATSQVATAPPDEVRRDPRNVGRPLEAVELRVEGGSGLEGEIFVRGPTLAARLWDGAALVDADGWYATGDLGRLDADGRLTVTGRRSARIVTGGVTVDPLEVEGVLRALDGVSDAGVVGVPDPEWGEAVWAAVVLSRPREGALDGEALRAAARARLAAPKVPKRIFELPSLPLNANGKLDRPALRERLARV